jgi:hypothetical protein
MVVIVLAVAVASIVARGYQAPISARREIAKPSLLQQNRLRNGLYDPGPVRRCRWQWAEY